MTPTATRARPPADRAARGRTGIDPRISARRAAVARQLGRRRLRLPMILLAGTAVLVGGWYLLHSPLFSARSITVSGNTQEPTAQVVQQSGLGRHPPLVDVNRGAVGARVERLPWVRSATVSLHWPDGVHIAVTEEIPQLVMSEPGGRWATLSIDGRVLAVGTVRPSGLIAVSGPQVPGAAGTVVGIRDRPGLVVASSLPASFGAQVTSVTVEPAGWVQLALTTPVLVDLGSPAQLVPKFEDVSSILAGASLHAGDVIDVSVPDAPTVTGG
ncbi:MAG TPA: FtsQ-type POTRA domain-containing protein [Acidimicrobiales bacterium]|nr:FtsQ-type POTRA domain-containing protein [Acidimicrobiales bacterium]